MRKTLTLLCLFALLFAAVMPAKAQTTLPCETPPTQLQAFRITHNSAELMWSAYETAYEYGLKVSTSPINPATAAADVFDTTIYFKPFVVTGLTPATTYYFYVSANCGTDGQSDWSTASTFTTGCAPIALPYSQDFEPSSDFTSCWGRHFKTSGTWTTTPSNAYLPAASTTSYSGTQGVRLYGYYNVNSNNISRSTQAWIVTPYINGSLNGKQVTFYGYTANPNARIRVGLMSDPGDPSTFSEIASVAPSATYLWDELLVPFNNLTDSTLHHVAFMVDGSDISASHYVYLDDIVIEDVPLCPKASVLTADNITSSTADFIWLGSAPAWNVKVATSALVDPATDAADVITTTVNTNTAHLTGLSPMTRYYAYVQANCQAAGNGTSIWVGPIIFKTLNTLEQIPYHCNFEDPAANALWECYNSNATSSTPNRWFIGSAVNNGGNNALYITNNDGVTNAYTNTSTTFAVATRTIQFPVGTFEISFDWRAEGEPSYDLLRAFLVPDNVDLSTGGNFGMDQANNTEPYPWISLPATGTDGQLQGSSNWQTANYLLTTTQAVNYQLVFFWKNDASVGNNPAAAIDNISVTPYTCAPPVNLSELTRTADGFTVAWTPSASGETQWEVEVREGTTTISNTVVITQFYTATGLNPQTQYNVRVRSVCGANDVSHWEAVDITTRCGGINALPYVEDFQNPIYGTDLGSFPTCWTKAKSVAANQPYIPTSNYQHTPGITNEPGVLYFSSNAATYNMVALPAISVPGKTLRQMQLSFFMLGSNAGNKIRVGVMSDPDDPTTFDEVALFNVNGTSNVNNQNWQECIVDFASYTGTGGYIAFSDSAGTSNYVYIDDVTLELTPTCKKMQNLTVSNVTPTGADLQWNGGTANSWEVAVMIAGTDETQAVQTLSVNNASATLANLTPRTAYEVSVRGICAPGDTSAWSTHTAFATPRMPDTLPYATTFSDAVDNDKWEISNGNSVNQWLIGHAVGDGDNNALYVSNDNGVNNNYTNTVTSYIYAYRYFHFDAGSYDISYRWLAGGESSFDFLAAYLAPADVVFNGSSTDRGDIRVGTTPTGWISLNGPTGFQNLTAAWQTVVTSINVAVPTDYFLVFYWENDYSTGTNPAAAVDNVAITQLSCSPIVQHEISDIYDVMHLSVSSGNVQSFEIAVNDAAFTAEDVDNVLYHNIITTNVDTIRNLAGNTDYYVLVRAICSAGDTSHWVASDFHTLCEKVRRLPFTWDFEDDAAAIGSPLDCWNAVEGGYPIVQNGNIAYGGSGNCLYMYSRTTTTPTILATPYINVQDLSALRLKFYLRAPTVGNGIIVGVVSDPTDATTFHALDTLFVDNADTWELKVAHFANYTGNGKYAAFKLDYGLKNDYCVVYLDHVTIEEDRYCDTPDGVIATQVTATGAFVQWNANNAITNDILITTEPVDPDTIDGTEPSVVIYEEALLDNHIDLTGYLNVNTTYWVYVKADCNAPDGRSSLWSEPGVFTTACSSLPLPYAEYFTVATPNVAGSLPDCWYGLTTQVGNTPAGIIADATCFQGSAFSYDGDTAHADLSALRLFAFNTGAASSKCFAFSPEFTGNFANYKLHFMVKGAITTRRQMLFGVIGDVGDASTFRVVDTIEVDNQWYNYGVAMADLQLATGERIALVADGDLSQTNVTFYIDNFVIDSITPCSAPANVSVTHIQGGDADIDVNVMSAADSFVQIQVTTDNVAPENLNANNLVVDTIVAVNALPLHVSDLSGQTNYFVYARVVCDPAINVFGEYADVPTAFTTGCASVTIPYSYGFDDASVNTRPRCWTAFTTGGHSSYPNISASQSASAPNSFYLYNASNSGDYAYGVLPEMKVASLNGLMVTFKMMRTSASTVYNNRLSVGVMTDPNDVTTFTELGIYTPTGTYTWEEVNVAFNSYIGTGKYIAFRTGGSNEYATIYLDDIYVDYAPSCYRPSRPLFLSATESSASFTWSAGLSGETAWEYVVVPAGGNPNNATPVATTSTTVSVGSLTPSTNYEFYVRAVCGGTDGNSAWSEGCAFRTMNEPEMLPLVTDFSDADDNALWTLAASGQTNQWVIGNAIGNGDIHALYVSNNNGVNNAYNTSSTSYVYAYRTLKFVPDNYTIEFDWKCNTGDTRYDGMRAFLTTDIPEAGNAYGMTSSVNSDPVGWISLTTANTLLDNHTAWTHVSQTLNVTDTVVYNLVFMWKNDNSVGTSTGAAAVDNVSIVGSYCLIDAVNAYASDVNEITIASATAHDVASYNIYISTTAMNENDLLAATPDTVVTAFPVVLGNLQSQATYHLYVVGNCSATEQTNVVETIITLESCAAPALMTTPAGNGVDVTITPAYAGDTAWELVVTPQTTMATPPATAQLVDTVVNALNVSLSGLAVSTNYTLFARTLCDATTSSEWTAVDFSTPCMIITVTPQTPFTENFDSYTSNITPTCWIAGTTDYSQLPKVMGSSYYASSAPNSVMFNATNAYIAMPPVSNDIHTLEVSFSLRRNSNYSGQFQVGVMSDPNDPSTFELVEDVVSANNGVAQQHSVSLANTTLTGANRYIAFRQVATNSTDYYHLDDVTVAIYSDCDAPVLSVAPSTTSAVINIAQNNGNPVEVILTTGNTPDAFTAIYATTTANNTVTVNGLVPATNYNVFIRTVCGVGSYSSWVTENFLTLGNPAALPLVCDFEQNIDDSDWLIVNDLDNQWVFGTATQNGGTRSLYVSNTLGYNNNYTSADNTSLAARHLHIEAGSYAVNYDWHTMGEDMNDYLRVYLAPSNVHTLNELRAWNNHQGVPTADCIALDGGSQLRGSTPWQTHAQSFTVNTTGDYLLVFQWHNNNALTYNPAAAIDNLFVGNVTNVNLADQICSGNGYTANGFNIAAAEIDVTQSPMTFSRLSGDTLTTVVLTILPAAETVIDAAICPGTAYTQNGFNETAAGTYHQYLTAANGCDSVVILHLTLLNGFHHHEQLTLCDSDVPYLWMGQSLTTTGSYTHTIAGPGVCDSIYTLDLVVNPTYTTNLDLEITPEELPYMWQGLTLNRAGTYVYHSVSRAGCDSVLLLTLTVTTVGLDYAEDGLFTISPNPVEKGGSVRLDVTLDEAERKGMVVEVFTSNGKLISREEPKRHPMYVEMPQEAGLYMVRLTTGSGRVLYGKVIVK